ncbi:class I SAM-dependent methyltransferase [Jiella pacifica]|uniref:SAM-dependent methyltransferase n=1 Tax=Jiella pacifica TaxID=2696469 RepID=A0A6N9SX88_9HYPH|nr:class I SAM-dependent methyltransferase [Jiella pacifica]NDW02922.1 SAM-dependent methyltransferase [Jiella pacifica]
MTETLSFVKDYYGHGRTIKERTPIWHDGSEIPWITYPALLYLMQLDYSNKSIFEYGAGNSTLFWSKRARVVTSVEHEKEWFEKISQNLPPHCSIRLASGADYVKSAEEQAPYDVIVIDGRWRYDCASVAHRYLAINGMIILDNSDRHAPAAALLRGHGLIQIDMIGRSPISKSVQCTSLFLTRGFDFPPKNGVQPQPVLGMDDPGDIAAKNKPGAYA